ncbi:hypothetical protein SAMN05192554_10855 [Haloarchaeobius iranensis]|uniref:Uncharacterized protein n=1 Tax=Haloarchaeobius iranensis TaxID=996166 RepID=A0A1G9WH56_9EURY|nr:hypothetical protein SAMN05192554_10855 [Haloarchaeobius iranensis]
MPRARLVGLAVLALLILRALFYMPTPGANGVVP